MSYCRTSTIEKGVASDVLVYAGSKGWTTHVAYNRVIKGKKVRIAGEIFSNQFRKLKHKYAGKTFVDSTKEKTIARLLHLKESGLRVPRCAINRLLDEIFDN